MADDDTTRIITRRSDVGDGTTTMPIGGGGFSRDTLGEDSHTRIFRPKATVVTTQSGVDSAAPLTDFSTEPVVGWLVVVEGPGRGQFVRLGYGMNSIGRVPDERVSLNFGDEEISRQGHAMLTYDAKGRKFYIQHGGGTNLTYLGDLPVLQPHEIKGREIIGIGNTRLCFVPFCGPHFEWQG